MRGSLFTVSLPYCNPSPSTTFQGFEIMQEFLERKERKEPKKDGEKEGRGEGRGGEEGEGKGIRKDKNHLLACSLT